MLLLGTLLLALVVDSARAECATIQCGVQTQYGVLMQTVPVPDGKEVKEVVPATTCINGAPVGMVATVCGSASPLLRCAGARAVTVSRGVEASAPAQIDILAYCQQPYQTGYLASPLSPTNPPMIQRNNLRNGGLRSLLAGNPAMFAQPLMSNMNPSGLTSLLPFFPGQAAPALNVLTNNK